MEPIPREEEFCSVTGFSYYVRFRFVLISSDNRLDGFLSALQDEIAGSFPVWIISSLFEEHLTTPHTPEDRWCLERSLEKLLRFFEVGRNRNSSDSSWDSENRDKIWFLIPVGVRWNDISKENKNHLRLLVEHA